MLRGKKLKIPFQNIERFFKDEYFIYACKNCYYPVANINDSEFHPNEYKIMIIGVEKLVKKICLTFIPNTQ